MNEAPRRSFVTRFWLASFVLAIFLSALAALGQSFTVTLLGTGNPPPNIRRFGPSTLVEAGSQKLLFDCGRGATIRLSQLKLSPAQIDVLFLTHLHSDHIVGIPDLYLTGWLMERKTPFRLFGPAGTAAMMTHLRQAYAFDRRVREEFDLLPPEGAQFIAHDIQQGVVYQSGGLKVTAFRVHHGPVKPAFGYRVDYAGHAVVISGDTAFSENLIRFARGADVVILNVIDPDAFRAQTPFLSDAQRRNILTMHTTPEQAGKIFSQVKPKLAVYYHFVPGFTPAMIPLTRKTYSGPLVAGEDLMEIQVGEKVTVRNPPH